MYIRLLTACLIVFAAACQADQETAQQSSSTSGAATVEARADVPAPADRLNLNTATEEEFLTIPAVGDRMVHEFFEYRPYESIQQFRREIGKYVDEEQVAAYEKYVYVPVDRNESNAATLQQIPGLDASEAKELIADRPYASNEAFLEALGKYMSEDQLSVGEAYVVH